MENVNVNVNVKLNAQVKAFKGSLKGVRSLIIEASAESENQDLAQVAKFLKATKKDSQSWELLQSEAKPHHKSGNYSVWCVLLAFNRLTKSGAI